jgi:hypothetical protein
MFIDFDNIRFNIGVSNASLPVAAISMIFFLASTLVESQIL